MTAKNRSLGQREVLGARRVDNHLLIHRHVSTTDTEGLLAIVDEDIGLWVVREDEMGRLRAVKRLIGIVHDVDELSQPCLGQVPGQHFGLRDDHSMSRGEGLTQSRIFLLQNDPTFLHDLGPSRMRGDLLQERLRHLNGLIKPLLNGLV